jgi:hypothetical protein
MGTMRARWFVVFPASLLVISTNAEELTATTLGAGTETIVDGSLTRRIVQGGFDNGSQASSRHFNASESQYNPANASARASATRALRAGAPPAVIHELPGSASADATAAVFAGKLAEDYANNPSSFNQGRSLGALAVASASVQYSQAWNLAQTAPDEAKQAPIPLEIRVVWSVYGSTGDVSGTLIDTGGGTVGLTMASGQQGYSTFVARTTQGNIQLVYSGFSEHAEDALENSGGSGLSSEYTGKPFTFIHYPNTPLTFTMVAEAGAAVNANVNNDWAAFGSGGAYIDPIVRVDPSYPYLDQLEWVVSDGYYIDVQELHNPLAGTPFEPIGVSLINAPYNTVPIPEPHTWVLILGGVGLILARARFRLSAAH